MRCLSSPLVDCPASCSGRLPHLNSRSIYQWQRPRHILHHPNTFSNTQQSVRCEASGNGVGNSIEHAMTEEITPKTGAPLIWTKFVAETLLPTGQGKFRLRGYRHTVRFVSRDCFYSNYRPFISRPPNLKKYPFLCCLFILQIDGGVTYTEPSAIISGSVEGQSEVRT
jgi:hypothetical protein